MIDPTSEFADKESTTLVPRLPVAPVTTTVSTHGPSAQPPVFQSSVVSRSSCSATP